MIRVLQIIGSLERAGAESFLVNLYKKTDRTKIQFDFAIYEKPTKESYYSEVIALGAQVFFLPKKSQNFFGNCEYIKKIVQDNHYQIVWRHTDGCVGGIDLLAAKCGGARKMILHSHNTKTVGIELILHYILRPFVNMYISTRFACGQRAGEWMFAKRKFGIIKNGIETEKFKYDVEIRKRYRNKYNFTRKIVIGQVGRFHKAKNQSLTVEIFEKIHNVIPETVLVFVGTGQTEEEIKKSVFEKKMEKQVVFFEKRNDVAELFQMMDVLVMPSLYEGYPVTLLEAQAAGLPCVVSNSITEEVNVTGNIRFLSLNASIDMWVNSIIEQIDKRNLGGL